MRASDRVSFTLLPIDRLSPRQLQEWSRLSSGVLEKNAYLCPELVLPSLDFGRGRSPLVLLASAPGPRDPEIHGVGIFEPCGPTAKFPLPHMRAYAGPPSLLTGLLVRKEGAGDACARSGVEPTVDLAAP